MKKIGILFGKENTFPQAFVERVNSKKVKGIVGEAVQVDVVEQADSTEYAAPSPMQSRSTASSQRVGGELDHARLLSKIAMGQSF